MPRALTGDWPVASASGGAAWATSVSRAVGLAARTARCLCRPCRLALTARAACYPCRPLSAPPTSVFSVDPHTFRHATTRLLA